MAADPEHDRGVALILRSRAPEIDRGAARETEAA